MTGGLGSGSNDKDLMVLKENKPFESAQGIQEITHALPTPSVCGI